MDKITVDDDVVRDHVGVMETSSDTLRRGEQAIDVMLDLGAVEPYSVTDAGVEFENTATEALTTVEAALAATGDHLLVMARKLGQLASEVTDIDQDLADRLRAIADTLDGGADPDAVEPRPTFRAQPDVIRPDALRPDVMRHDVLRPDVIQPRTEPTGRQ